MPFEVWPDNRDIATSPRRSQITRDKSFNCVDIVQRGLCSGLGKGVERDDRVPAFLSCMTFTAVLLVVPLLER